MTSLPDHRQRGYLRWPDDSFSITLLIDEPVFARLRWASRAAMLWLMRNDI
jgi:hypothetical protein